ncbi:hypothetical protein L7F22_056000 [Adiantum nelumboides]|nr:hypothetical protein [Adiantum nelumboides]
MAVRPNDVTEEVSSSQGQQTPEVGESSRPPQTDEEIFRAQLVAAVTMFSQVMQNPKFLALLQPPLPSQPVETEPEARACEKQFNRIFGAISNQKDLYILLCAMQRSLFFCSDNSVIRLEKIEHYVREDLNKISRRAMVVLKPLKVVIKNIEENAVMNLHAKYWPDAADDDDERHYEVPFSKVVYIESSDFRIKDSKDYYGLSLGKTVMLRYAFPIKCVDVVYTEDQTTVVEIHAEYDPAKSTKPKGVIHWVAEPSCGTLPLKVEVRLFETLFLSENPGELDDWLADLNPNSKTIIAEAFAVPVLKNACLGDRFQFERLGYFCVDQDSTSENIIFNRSVSLRDSYVKTATR